MLEEADLANGQAMELAAGDRARKKSVYESTIVVNMGSPKKSKLMEHGGTIMEHGGKITGRIMNKLNVKNVRDKLEQRTANAPTKDPVTVLGFGRYQLFWSIIFGLGTFSFMFELNVGPLLLDIYANCIRSSRNGTSSTGHSAFNHPTKYELLMWAVSNFALTIPGILTGYVLSYQIHSKVLIALGTVTIAICTFIEAFLTSFVLIILAKVMSSFGIGLSLLISIVHILEITPTQYRSFSIAGMIATWGLSSSTLFGIGAIFHWGWTTIFVEGILLMSATCALVFLISSPSALIRMGSDPKIQTQVISTISKTNHGQTLSNGVDKNVPLLPDDTTPELRDFFTTDMMKNTVALLAVIFSSTFLYSSLVQMAPVLLSKRCKDTAATALTENLSTHRRTNLDTMGNHTCIPSFGYDIHLSLFLSSFSDWLVVPFVALLSAFLESVKTLRLCTLLVPLVHVTLIFCFSDVLYSLFFSLYRGAVSAVIYSALVSGSELFQVHMILPLLTILLSCMSLSAVVASSAAHIIGDTYGATILLIYLTPFTVGGVISTWFIDANVKFPRFRSKDTLGIDQD